MIDSTRRPTRRTASLLAGSACLLLLPLFGCDRAAGPEPAPGENAEVPADTTATTAPDDPAAPPVDPADAEAPKVLAGPRAVSPVRFEPAMEGLPQQGMWKCDPIFGDVTGDGRLELVAIPRLGEGARVFRRDAGDAWTMLDEGLVTADKSCGGGVGLGDLDGDGDLDLVVADHCQGTFVYLNAGDGTFVPVVEALYARDVFPDEGQAYMYQGMEDVAIGDVDGDGDLDFVTGASDEGGLHVWLNDGSGNAWQRQENALPHDGWANRVHLADLDGDGDLDLLAAHSVGPRVWLNDGDAGWTESSAGLPSPPMQGIFFGIDAADLNGDGLVDLAVANWIDGPEVYFAEAAGGGWRKAPDVFPDLWGGAVGVALADADGDGDVDLALTGRLDRTPGTTRGVFLMLNDGAGAFSWASGTELPETGMLAMTGLVFADVDDDGVLDLAACSGLRVETGAGVVATPTIPEHLLFWRGLRAAE